VASPAVRFFLYYEAAYTSAFSCVVEREVLAERLEEAKL